MTNVVKEVKLREARNAEAMFGKGFYRVSWENLPTFKKLWWTLKGHNPGGRAGAPTFEEVES